MSKKTTNTEKNGAHMEWVLGGNPSAIEQQEAAGQQELIASSQLPLRCNSPRNCNTTEIYAKMGIKVFTPSKGDDLFVGVKLPDGWKKESTDHSMWNNLVDNKGRIRATFFYKAAFYDRDAFINFRNRYTIEHEYVNSKDPYCYYKFYCVKDNATGQIIFRTEDTKEYYSEKDENACKEYAKANFPDYDNVLAYWD